MMPTDFERSPPDDRGAQGLRLASVAIVAAALTGVIVWSVARDNRVSLGVERGRLVLDIEPGTERVDFGNALAAAVKEQPVETAALLNELDYYHIADEGLLAEIQKLEDVVSNGRDRVANGVVVGLVEQSLDGKRPFHRRPFRAEVVRLPGSRGRAVGDRPVVYACPPNWLRNKGISFATDQGLVTGLVDEADARLDCTGAQHTVANLITGDPVRLGLDEDVFEALVSPGDDQATSVGEEAITFLVYPSGLVPLPRSAEADP